MKMETFNTILLVILVALSLILTAYVWTFQPNSLRSDQSVTEEPKTLDGEVKQLADIVQPEHMYVHNNNKHFIFSAKKKEQAFEEELAQWTLTNTRTNSLDVLPETSIELVYPVAVSYSQLNALFQVEGGENVTSNLGDGVFNRVYLEPNEDNTTSLIFVNENQENPLGDVITATAARSIIDIMNDGDLISAVPLSDKNAWNQIYLPNSIQVSDSNVRSETISRSVFADIYMEEPSIRGSDQYIDTNRLKSVQFKNNGQAASYNFLNSSSARIGTTSRADQLQAALNTINSHKGWTNDFNLFAVNGEGSYTFQFRMVRNGYPIFQTNGLSLLSIRMVSNLPDPVSYERTLLHLSATGKSDGAKTLEAQDVLEWLEENQYNKRDIQDVAIGYMLEENDTSAIYKYHMRPSWFVKSQGEWEEVEASDTGGES
ncbi:YycH family regulatory protein [Terribacillus saccharophilus]|uniref:YycH family regulatory protein n=1 Tax=Terribacillus saccharophilus TaxID=361277 RepID=UPI002989FBF7|nr:two-component system activity regulator YycH [Terribacillus saccharophilus]MCM3227020.1 two-component system activity regulator YycH [Terribacillus saccharophilus]